MANKNRETQAQGLSMAELESEVLSVLPEREEMSGCNRWFNCWHPCYDYTPCYDYNPCYNYTPCYDYNRFNQFSQFSR